MALRYVYYRVLQASVGEVRAALQAEIAAGHLELLRRPGADKGLVTLMEVHRETGDAGIEARAAAAVAPWLRGERHVELFERLT